MAKYRLVWLERWEEHGPQGCSPHSEEKGVDLKASNGQELLTEVSRLLGTRELLELKRVG